MPPAGCEPAAPTGGSGPPAETRWPGTILALADHGDVEGVILTRRLAGVVRNHLDVVRVVSDGTHCTLNGAATGTCADHAAEVGIARPTRGHEDQLPGDRASEVEDVLPSAWLRRGRNAAGLDDDAAVRRNERPLCAGAGRTGSSSGTSWATCAGR